MNICLNLYKGTINGRLSVLSAGVNFDINGLGMRYDNYLCLHISRRCVMVVVTVRRGVDLAASDFTGV